MQKLIGLFLAMNMSLAMATDWNCRNQDMEISCHSNKCEVSDGFTPMDIHFNDKGKISICAYTGCWEGVGRVLKSDNYRIITGHNLKFSTSSSRADFLIAIDIDDAVSVLKGAGFAMPLICNTTKSKE